MNNQDFLSVIERAFKPFLGELGFVMGAPILGGKFYQVSFEAVAHAVTVSYEPGEDYLVVLVFQCKDGRRPDVDDRTRTLRLTDLNVRYMAGITPSERIENERFFASVVPSDLEEGTLLSAAKELRLVLPRHIRPRH